RWRYQDRGIDIRRGRYIHSIGVLLGVACYRPHSLLLCECSEPKRSWYSIDASRTTTLMRFELRLNNIEFHLLITSLAHTIGDN
ncbi:MAG TPA: hypothetical protein VN920_01245, partial [Pyrinomonadaceae bacterium]|nr:hypothetical protein [Pyrinomonadaceae bacterium]